MGLAVESDADLATFFEASEFGATATYRVQGRGEETTVTVILSQADEIGALERLSTRRVTTTMLIRVSEAPMLAPGDTFDIADDRYEVQGQPVRDLSRAIWTVDTRKCR